MMKIQRIPEYIFFIWEWFEYRQMCKAQNIQKPRFKDIRTAFGEKGKEHVVEAHTFSTAAWCSRVLKQIMPLEHYDVAGNTTLMASLSAFFPIKSFDIRNIKMQVENLEYLSANAISLPIADESIFSLSCLHVAEHIGLGRYGDELDPMGAERAFVEFDRVLKPEGHLLLTLPTGQPCTYFHVTRVFDKDYIISLFPNYDLNSFSFFPEGEESAIDDASNDVVRMSQYGLGCYWFIKKKRQKYCESQKSAKDLVESSK